MKSLLLFSLSFLLLISCHTDNSCYHSDNTLSPTIVGKWNAIGMRFERVSEVSCFEIDSLGLNNATSTLTLMASGTSITENVETTTKCNYTYSQSERRFYSFACDSINGPRDTMEVAYLDDEYLVMITLVNPKDTNALPISVLFKRIR